MKKIKITEDQYNRLIKEVKSAPKKVKLTQEQYNKLVLGGLINESINVKSLGPDVLKTPIEGTRTLSSKVGNRPMPTHEQVEGGENKSHEFIKFLYGKIDKLSEEWSEESIKTIISNLSDKEIIIAKDGNFEISKALGTPQGAMQAIEQEIAALPQVEIEVEPEAELEVGLEEEGNLGHEGSDRYGAPDDESNPTPQSIESPVKVVDMNDELAILSNGGKLFVFRFWDDIDNIKKVTANLEGHDNLDNVTIDKDSIENFIADAYNGVTNELKVGKGVKDFDNSQFNTTNGVVVVIALDDEIRQFLLDVYGNDPIITNALNQTNEGAGKDFKANVKSEFEAEPKLKKTPEEIKAALKLKRDQELAARPERDKLGEEELDEMTSTGSVGGSFVAPLGSVVKKEVTDVPVVAETSTVASVGGQYDTPGLANVGRNGEYKDGPKTKAEKTTQWAGGSFVEQPDCSKMNNNKSAQNGGCNSGASSLKTKKTGGSINAPSLGENTIYETIAKQTGRSVDEVKRIIESKNGKA